MSSNVLSILLVGDSHVAGYRPQQCEVKDETSGQPLLALLQPVFLSGAYFAMDMAVTFPDGRLGLNPLFENALRNWPGLDIKGRPILPGSHVQKHLVLSLGTGLSAYDPAIEYGDRAADRLLFRHDVDFVLPDLPDLPVDPACVLLPVDLIREMFESILIPLKTALEFLANQYSQRLWIVGTPPPAESNAAKLKLMTERAAKLATAGAPISTREVLLPSPIISYKLWRLVTKLVRSICAEAGCGFIDCATVACAASGYLRPEFEHDGVHGNAHYNDLMARHIVSIVAAREMSLPR